MCSEHGPAVARGRRGVFGGSFDPVHVGHLAVAAAAANRLSLDRVHFVPTYRQPFKAAGHVASVADRVRMLELALADDPRFVVDRREVDRAGTSYSVETLRSLRDAFPGDDLFLLVGADAAEDLPHWKEAGALAALATVVVLTRPGVTVPQPVAEGCVLDIPPVPVSASAIRARVRAGQSIAGLVPEPVAAYIAEHALYR